MKLGTALFLACSVLYAEIIDRISLTVGRTVISESQINTEIRVTAFLEDQKPDFAAASRKQAIDRLINQTLIRREIELTRFPAPKPADADPLLAQVKAAHPKPAPDLAAAGLKPDELSRHLLWQLTLLRFVEYRFRPAVNISEPDLRNFYDQQAAKWHEADKAIPPFNGVRTELEALLTQQRVDQALDRWLGEQRTQTPIIFRDGPVRKEAAKP